MCTAIPTVYRPRTESNAISLAMSDNAGELLDSLTMLRRAERLSDLILASTCVPGSQILMATKMAKASQVVLCLQSPFFPNLRWSAPEMGLANQAMGLLLLNRTPAKPQGHASVAM